MPIYEYDCEACQGNFELLRPMSTADDGVECVHCGAKSVQRKLSVFAAATASAGSEFAPPSCACGAPPELSCANSASQCNI